MGLAILVLTAAIAAPSVSQSDANWLVKAYSEMRVDPPVRSVVAIDVAPDGSVIGCKTGQAEGSAVSLRRICPGLEKMRIAHVAQIDGMPAYGRIVTVVSMPQIAGGAAMGLRFLRGTDLDLQVSSLPAGLEGMDLNLLVSDKGVITGCSGAQDAPEGLAKSACSSLSGIQRPVVKDVHGNPVSYVTSLKARFVVSPAAG